MPRPTLPARRWADALRRAFDHLARPLGPATPVALLLALAAAVGLWRASALRHACADQAVALLPLELTFDARRFAALLGGLARVRATCEPAVVRSFVTYDVLLAVSYAAALCALLLWLERWRRFDPDDRPTGAPLGPARDVAVLLPLAAAACELAAERVPLWTAAHAPALGGLLVVVGSLGAAAKWTLVALAFGAGLAELLRGPRGVALRRVRYSALALALGAVPLALVPQGQDVLQRLVEGEHPWVRVGSALLALAFAAAAVWYCARKLVELRVAAEQPAGDPAFAGWYRYFAEQLPRLLGTAVLAAGAAAFALAGLDPARLALWAGAGLLAAVLLERFAPAAMERAGRVLLPRRHWRDVPRFGARAAAVAVTTLVAALGVWPSDRSLPDAVQVLRVAAWLAVGAAGAFYLAVLFRRARRAAREAAPGLYAARLGELRGRAVDAVHPAGAEPRLQLGVLAAAVASFVALALFTYAPVPVARWVGPVWVLAVAVSNAVFIGSLTVWAGYRYRVRVVPWALGLAVLFSVWNDNHLVRAVPSAAVAARPALRAYVRGWLGRAPADTGPVVLVAASGGGLRAAYWAAVTLATVQDSNPGFAARVLAVSGVSGGSLGAAVFAALVRDGGAVPHGALPCAADTLERLHTAAPRGPLATCVRRFMRDDFLSPVLAKLVAPDAAQNFVPWPVYPADRSTALEGSWARSYEAAAGRRTLDTAFLAFAGAAPNAAPALVLNATHVETGRRYVAAPFRVPVGDGAGAFGAAGDLLGALGADLSLAAAVHNSARFPYVSPAGRLERDGESLGRVVDGGYFEDSGLATLQDVYGALRLELDALGRRRPVLVVYLCNDPTTCEGSVDRPVDRPPAAAADGRADADSAAAADPAPRFGRGAASELLAPVRALLHARDARGELARARLRAEVGEGQFLELDVCAGLPARAVPTDSGTARLARDRAVSPPLGWLLSRLAREWMDGSLVADAPATQAAGPATCRARNAAAVARLAALR